MGTTPTHEPTDDGDEVTYEVRTGGGLISLRLRRDGREVAFSTDRWSAVTMASDLLRAVQHSSARARAGPGDGPAARDRANGEAPPRLRAELGRAQPGRR